MATKQKPKHVPMDDSREDDMVSEATEIKQPLIPVTDRPAGLLAPIPSYPLPMPDGRTERLLTSYNPTDQDHAAKVFDCINSEDFKGDWAKQNVLEVEHVLIHPTEYTDEETGEVRHGSRVVLVTPDGTRVALHSNGVIKAILLACSFFGCPPWQPARKFRVKEIPTAGKRRFYTLEIAR